MFQIFAQHIIAALKQNITTFLYGFPIQQTEEKEAKMK